MRINKKNIFFIFFIYRSFDVITQVKEFMMKKVEDLIKKLYSRRDEVLRNYLKVSEYNEDGISFFHDLVVDFDNSWKKGKLTFQGKEQFWKLWWQFLGWRKNNFWRTNNRKMSTNNKEMSTINKEIVCNKVNESELLTGFEALESFSAKVSGLTKDQQIDIHFSFNQGDDNSIKEKLGKSGYEIFLVFTKLLPALSAPTTLINHEEAKALVDVDCFRYYAVMWSSPKLRNLMLSQANAKTLGEFVLINMQAMEIAKSSNSEKLKVLATVLELENKILDTPTYHQKYEIRYNKKRRK